MTIKVGPDGRVLVPAALRRRMKLHPGTLLVARVQEDRLVLERREAVLERLQDRFSELPAGVSLADELIADRRQEAERENASG